MRDNNMIDKDLRRESQAVPPKGGPTFWHSGTANTTPNGLGSALDTGFGGTVCHGHFQSMIWAMGRRRIKIT